MRCKGFSRLADRSGNRHALSHDLPLVRCRLSRESAGLPHDRGDCRGNRDRYGHRSAPTAHGRRSRRSTSRALDSMMCVQVPAMALSMPSFPHGGSAEEARSSHAISGVFNVRGCYGILIHPWVAARSSARASASVIASAIESARPDSHSCRNRSSPSCAGSSCRIRSRRGSPTSPKPT
jgi:hypothetical protein